MTDRPTKSRADSITHAVHIVFPQDVNGNNRLFGGKLMEWIDIVAGVTARRHSGCEVTTASIEHLDFAFPAYRNDTIALVGEIVSCGNTSMRVKVTTNVEHLDGSVKQINIALLVVVALDDSGKPTRVPQVI